VKNGKTVFDNRPLPAAMDMKRVFGEEMPFLWSKNVGVESEDSYVSLFWKGREYKMHGHTNFTKLHEAWKEAEGEK
jgi:hypothetical protein